MQRLTSSCLWGCDDSAQCGKHSWAESGRLAVHLLLGFTTSLMASGDWWKHWSLSSLMFVETMEGHWGNPDLLLCEWLAFIKETLWRKSDSRHYFCQRIWLTDKITLNNVANNSRLLVLGENDVKCINFL